MSFIKDISLYNFDLFLLDFSIYENMKSGIITYQFDCNSIVGDKIYCEVDSAMSTFAQDIK